MSESDKSGDSDGDVPLRINAIVSLLADKGLVNLESLDAIVQAYETSIGPHNGAKVVARAWVDPAYKKRLLGDCTAAIAEFGFTGAQGANMVVVENTAEVHNLVVCTLCSYYPWPVLGLPPTWYKSPPYRARVVRDPRGVLREFGVELEDQVKVQVWDSNSEIRYLVLPERPAGTQGMSEEELAGLVTRNSMIGTEKAAAPG